MTTDDTQHDAPLRRRVTVGIALALISITLMGFLSWRSRRWASAEIDLLGRTQSVIQGLQSTLEDIVETETSGRGFALSGNTALLAHYRASRSTATRDVDTLRQLTTDNLILQQRVDLLEPQISAALAFADGMVARRLQTQAVPDAPVFPETQRLMDAVQDTIQTMRAEEFRLLVQRTQTTAAAHRLTNFFIVSSTLVAAVFLVLSGFAIRREMNANVGVRARINMMNADLEQRVAQRTNELTYSRQAFETQSLMLQSVLDGMAEGLVAADEQGHFVIWNPAAEKILGLGAASLDSEKWSEHYGLFLEDMVTPFPADSLPLMRAIRGEASTAQMFVRNPKLADGSWIEASASPLKDKAGAVRGGVVAFRDITEKRTSDREIQRLNSELEHRVAERTAQLEEANQELESFTYSVAHDLRAPLRHVAGFSGILVEEFSPVLNSEAQRYLQRIQEGTQKMGRLVDELLNLARLGRQALVLQVSGLNSIVQEVIGMLQPDIEGRQVEWKIADLPFVECDPTLMKQVFQNLISNALKYTRPRSPAVIEIGQTRQNERPVVFVRDNGVGFNMKYADKLFGVFERLHRSEDFEGTGVGLATVRRIIKKHHGEVWGEAELDKGATFSFTLGGMQPADAKELTTAVGA